MVSWYSDGSINSQEYKSFEIYVVTIKISMTEYHNLKPMDSFGMWWKSNEIIFLHWIIILYKCSSVWIINALSIVCSEMLKLSRNNPKYQNVRGPPEHSAIGNIHRDILLLGIINL